MLPDSYITDVEQKDIREENCAKLIAFKDLRKILKDWYKELALEYPHTCENNYRDSWFHYRKLYKEHSAYEVVRQAANFDEHLQRAEKDAIIHLSQEIISVLEYWYFIGDYIDESSLESEIFQKDKEDALAIFDAVKDSKPSQWVYDLHRKYLDNNAEFAKECVYIMKNRVYSPDFRKKIQNVLHEVKNIVLDIRTGGAQIERQRKPGYYVLLFKNCYEKVLDVCYEYGLTGLFSVTWTVNEELCSKNLCKR